MSKLPMSDFQWLTDDEISKFDLETLDVEGGTGYILECDLKYPKKLHKSHNNLTLAPEFLEITNKNISKGNAVKKLVEKLGISLEEVAAIGDSFNDVSMLEVAGFSCAVGNANSEIKKIVDFVSSSNNDSGLANFIKEMKKDI